MPDPSIPDLLKHIDEAYNEVASVVATLSDEQLQQTGADGWSPQDHIAHLATWERILLCRLTGGAECDALELDSAAYEALDLEGINRRSLELGRRATAERARAALLDAHFGVVAALESPWPRAWDEPWLPGHPERGTLYGNVVGNTCEHFEEHAESLRALLASHDA
jgi:hypothetical protein